MKSITIVKRVSIYLSIALFLFALTQPCLDTKDEAGDIGQGLALLISGFFGLFSSGTALVWLANPTLLGAWICSFIKRPNRAFILSLIASLVAWAFLDCTTIMADEAGHFSTIINYRIGYWLWLASCVVMFGGSLTVLIMWGYWLRRSKKRSAETEKKSNPSDSKCYPDVVGDSIRQQ